MTSRPLRPGLKIDVVNRPKAIGTAAETAVLKAIKTLYPDARRVVLHGREDEGDLHAWMNEHGDPAIVIEVKGGAQANLPSDAQIREWLGETIRERNAAQAHLGLLVTQRRGVGAPNAERWWCWMAVGELEYIITKQQGHAPSTGGVVRMLLKDALELLEMNGWSPGATP